MTQTQQIMFITLEAIAGGWLVFVGFAVVEHLQRYDTLRKKAEEPTEAPEALVPLWRGYHERHLPKRDPYAWVDAFGGERLAEEQK